MTDAASRRNEARIRRKIARAARLYNIEDWDIGLVLRPGADEEVDDTGWRTDGTCDTVPRYHQARLTIMDDLGDREDHVVRHEAAHVLLGEVRGAVIHIVSLLPEK